ncbi:MAG: hypothetical protein ACI8P3_001302 [Saprospiraceae bacterium]|jgi:hypothetical protein
MIKILTLFLLPFLVTIPTTVPSDSAHEFHISKCQIDFDKTTEAVQVTLHLFLDDLEAALKEQGADKMFLCSDKEDSKAEKYLLRYFQQGFKLKVNEEAVDFEFIGKEQSEDLQAVWCYLEVTNIKFFNSIEVTNSLLMEVFEDQKNIVHIKAPDNKQGYFLFQKGQEHDKVTF